MRRYLMTALAVLLLSGLALSTGLRQRADALSAQTAGPATGEPGSVDGLPDASMLADLAVHAEMLAANPPPEPLPFDTHSAETEMQAADFASDHGITEQDATQRLRWQYESQALTDQLPIVLGDAYAGHWFDHDDGGRLKIAVAADPVPPALVASLRQHGTQSFTDVVQVANSLRDLSTTATHLLIAVNDVEPTIDVGMRPSANAVVLKVPADVPDRTVDSIRSRRPAAFDRHVVIERRAGPPAEPAGCRRVATEHTIEYLNQCDPPLRGGVYIGTDGAPRCTGGFVTQSRVDTKKYFLTAGHCIDPPHTDTTVYTRFAADGSLHNIGKEHNHSWGNNKGDYGIISVDNPSGWQATRSYVFVLAKSGETTRDELYPIRTARYAAEGERVCYTGTRTGTDCGTVIDPSTTYTTRSGVKVIRVTQANGLCPQGGDSGGPVYSYNAAYGLVSGYREVLWTCDLYYSRIGWASDEMNVKLLYAP